MLLGATILCFLVLLVLLAERLSGRLWRGPQGSAMYRCPDCDLRYPATALHDPTVRTCPAGHRVVVEPEAAGGASLVAIFACLGFLTVAVALLLANTGS